MTGTTTIHSDELFDGTRLHGPSAVRVRSGVIEDVTPWDGMDLGDGSEAVRAPFAMPGLIDSHVHVIGVSEGMPAGAPFEPVKHFLRMCLLNGVTTVRDTGNFLETILYVREWTERYTGPRVLSAGPLLDVPPLAWPHSRIVRDEAAVKREVDRLYEHDVEWLKAYRNTTPDLVKAIVDAGQERGLPVAIDSQRTNAITASNAGVRSIEHMTNLLDVEALPERVRDLDGAQGRARMWAHVDVDGDGIMELAETLVHNGTWIVPTLLVSRRWCFLEEAVNDPNLDYAALVMPYHRHFKSMQNPIGMRIGRSYASRFLSVGQMSRSERSEAEEGLRKMRSMLRRLFEGGVRVAAGTDTPNPSLAPGFSLHQELAEMVSSGLAPVDALRCATSNAAELLSRPEIGVVAPGKAADLVLIDGNPAVDIQELRRVSGVMRDGRWVDLEGIDEKLRAVGGS